MGRFSHAVVLVLLLAPVVGLALAAGAAPAVAQEPDAQRTAAARALFQEGLALVQQQNWPEAVDRFRRTLELRASAPVRLNLGLALAQTGQLVEAEEMLRNAAQDPTANESVRHQANAAVVRVDARIGRITIRVEGAPAGNDVTFDGHAVATATIGVAVPADPGTHTVTLVHDGHTLATQTVVVPEGGPVEVTLTPELAVSAATVIAPPPVAAETAHEPTLFERWWFWAAVGGAVTVGIVIAIIAVAVSGSPTPVSGNFDPAVLHVQVSP